MNRDELDTAIEWAALEGWNPGLNDALPFYETDPEGYIALEHQGEMIGCGSIVSYSGQFGFMGFFIIKPEYRFKGIGTILWNKRKELLLSRLQKNCIIGMDGVFNMQSFYAKGGFEFSHRNLRMEGIAKEHEYSNFVSKIESQDFERILKFDKLNFGFHRETFLKHWLAMPDSYSVKYIKNDVLMGFGMIRKCRSGFKIAPLFAVDYEVALEIYKALSTYAKTETIYLDIPEINTNAVKLAEAFSMTEMFGTARMYCGGKPELPYNQIFGVTTFELG